MIIAYIGKRRRGKTLGMLSQGLALAEEQHSKALCFNFSINYHHLLKYAAYRKLWWVCNLIQKGQIFAKSSKELTEFLDIKNCIYFFDEAGVYLKARKSYRNSEDFLDDISLSGKGGKVLIYSAQHWSQVDVFLRNQTERVVFTEGLITYPKGTSIPKLVAIKETELDAIHFEKWFDNVYCSRSFTAGVKTKALAFRQTFRFIGREDRLLFNAYNSFEEVPDVPTIVGQTRVKEFCKYVM